MVRESSSLPVHVEEFFDQYMMDTKVKRNVSFVRKMPCTGPVFIQGDDRGNGENVQILPGVQQCTIEMSDGRSGDSSVCVAHVLFEVNGKWFLLVTDCFSKVPFVRTVPNTGALATIKALKNIMGENGVPVKVISDNGVHFVAHEFKKFSKQYGFEMIFSSPRYARGHALIERHVQTIEKCMIKCKASGQDFDLALLALRATPLDSSLKSPGEILNGRKYRSTLPDISHIRSKQSADNKSTRQKLQQKQSASATYYNRSTKSKNAPSPGQNV